MRTSQPNTRAPTHTPAGAVVAESQAADMGRLLKRKFNDRIAQLTEDFARKRSKVC